MMMAAMWRAWLVELRRDRVAFALTFVLPIVFFSVFGVMFGGTGGSGTPRVRVAVVDEDGSEASRRLVEALKKEEGLRVVTEAPGEGEDRRPLDRAGALEMVGSGRLPAAVVIPKGFGEEFGLFMENGVEIELLVDTSDPIAGPMIAGLLQGVAMTAAPDLMMARGMEIFERYGGALTAQQRAAVDAWLPVLRGNAQGEGDGPDDGDAEPSRSRAGFQGPVAVKIVDVLGEKKQERGKVVSFSAAGIAVMFLLFMASAGAGTLLEAQESGVLERLLGTRLSMTQLLLGKWAFLTAVGFAQVTVMFLWGAAVFGLDLWGHLGGFAVMTATTAAAGSALGLVLAAACRSRAQLGAVSTIVILTMSAAGGSMVPRMFMPEAMRTIGLGTFNAWAVDGYLKIFWFETGVLSVWPQVCVLVAMTGVFLVTARMLARKWEVG